MCVCLEACAEMQHMAYRDTSLSVCVYVGRAIVFTFTLHIFTHVVKTEKLKSSLRFMLTFFTAGFNGTQIKTDIG